MPYGNIQGFTVHTVFIDINYNIGETLCKLGMHEDTKNKYGPSESQYLFVWYKHIHGCTKLRNP